MQHRKCQDLELELDRYDDPVHKWLRLSQTRTAFCAIALIGKRGTKLCFSPVVLEGILIEGIMGTRSSFTAGSLYPPRYPPRATSRSSHQIFVALGLINAKWNTFTTTVNHVGVQQFQLALAIPVKALVGRGYISCSCQRKGELQGWEVL